MEWLLLFKSVGIGIMGGFVSGLTGMGGGGIFVPVFYFIFNLPVKNAIGTSLLVIVFSSLSAGISHWKCKTVYFPVAVVVSIFGFAGAQAGAYIVDVLPDVFVKFFFIVLVFSLGMKMWVHSGGNLCPENTGDRKIQCAWWKVGLIGLVGGIVSAMGGVGGAVFIIPLLHFTAGIPMAYCIGTTLVVVLVNSVSGSIGYYMRNLVEFNPGIFVAAGAVISAPFGAKLSTRLRQKTLRRIFAIILLVAGLLMFFNR